MKLDRINGSVVGLEEVLITVVCAYNNEKGSWEFSNNRIKSGQFWAKVTAWLIHGFWLIWAKFKKPNKLWAKLFRDIVAE